MNHRNRLVLFGAVLAGVLGYFFTLYGQNAQFPNWLIGTGTGVIVLVVVLGINLASKK